MLLLPFLPIVPLFFNVAFAGDLQVPVVSGSSPGPVSCAPVKERLQGWNGYVAWTKPDNSICNETRIWIIDVPRHHGIVLHVQDIKLTESSYLRIYSSYMNNIDTKIEEIRVWSQTHRPFPITIIRGTAVLKFERSKFIKYHFSLFNISYAVHPLRDLPQAINMQSDMVSSSVMFNCSSSTTVPQAMACDGVQHCIGDEDEEDCEYRQQGCENWVPYGDQCLKVEFLAVVPYISGAKLITHHTEAEKACHNKYGGNLAVLPDKEGKGLVANMIHKSGFRSVSINLRKVTPVSQTHEHLYRYLWQWGHKGSPIAHEEIHIQRKGTMQNCAVLHIVPVVQFVPVTCMSFYVPHGYVCQRPNPRLIVTEQKQTHGVHLPEAKRSVHQFSTKQCDDGSVVQVFHQCQWRDHVLSTSWSPNHLPLFHCMYGPPVHYSLLCDGLNDCADGSDELGCLLPQTLSKNDDFYICQNHQLIPQKHKCNGVTDCLDGTDEQNCASCQDNHCFGTGCVPYEYAPYFEKCTKTSIRRDVLIYPPGFASITLDGYGMSSFHLVPKAADIQEGYVLCDNGFYIPTYLLNNGELDCPKGEDENIPLENFTCPGFYRCQYYGNCVYSIFLCDGIPHCPNKDDERYCNLLHPSNCTCEGYACSCHVFSRPVSDFWYLRYLDVSGVYKPPVDELATLDFLQFLNASFCQLTNIIIVGMPQLKALDLSYNALSGLSSMVMESLTGLTLLNISGNPLVTQLDGSFSAFLTHAGLIHIKHLVMTNTHVSHIYDSSFSTLAHLVSLDIRNNKLERYDKNVFRGLHSLTILQTDESRLCCSYYHKTMPDCYAPVNELSSCSDLLRLNVFRLFLWMFSLMTILGNSGVLMYRVVSRTKKKVISFQILVNHLCVADFLMGIYMMIIGAADAYFRGGYVANERHWRQSGGCLAAGFLAFVSSEMSAFMICLITLDRLLMLCFPFKSHLHLTAASSMKLSCAAWVLCLLLAAVPLIGQLEFYGESTICLPLPITRHQFSGHTYAFLVFIVLNFILFLFIGTGQLAIYWTLRKTRRAVRTQQQEEDSAIAQRLFLVVFTDFCCWFPVGLIGLMAFAGLPIPGEVSVWVAVFVMPVNSALNPFLYTLNIARERWKVAKMNQKSKRILGNLKGEFPKLAPDVVEELMLGYLGSNRGVRMEKVAKVLQSKQENQGMEENKT